MLSRGLAPRRIQTFKGLGGSVVWRRCPRPLARALERRRALTYAALQKDTPPHPSRLKQLDTHDSRSSEAAQGAGNTRVSQRTNLEDFVEETLVLKGYEGVKAGREIEELKVVQKGLHHAQTETAARLQNMLHHRSDLAQARFRSTSSVPPYACVSVCCLPVFHLQQRLIGKPPVALGLREVFSLCLWRLSSCKPNDIVAREFLLSSFVLIFHSIQYCKRV